MIDVCEREAEIVIFVEMPGVDKSDIQLSWSEGAGPEEWTSEDSPSQSHPGTRTGEHPNLVSGSQKPEARMETKSGSRNRRRTHFCRLLASRSPAGFLVPPGI
jgi:hypothetical protein